MSNVLSGKVWSEYGTVETAGESTKIHKEPKLKQ